MREEIAAAVVFMTRLVRQNGSVSKEKVEEFSGCLSAILSEKFKNHWYSDHPTKGQGYRCIRINDFEPIDPVLKRAASDCGLRYRDLRLPPELTLWVDPDDVCCRIGESRGSFCTLAAKKDGSLENRAHSINIEELIEQGKEYHNQQVNIVTTRSNTSSEQSRQNFSKGLHYGANSNFYSKQQHNYYNNQQFQNTHNRFRPQNKNQNRRNPQGQEQVNGVRYSPEHVNEVRQKFMEQVTTAARGKEGAKLKQPKAEIPKGATSSASTSSTSTTSSSSSSTAKSNTNATTTTTKSTLASTTSQANTPSNKASSSPSHSAGPKPSGNATKQGNPTPASKTSQVKGKGAAAQAPPSNSSVKPGSYNGGKQNTKGSHDLNQKMAQKAY